MAKVEVRETAAIHSEYREFLFADGILLFFMRSEKKGAGAAAEERIYFSDGWPLLRVLGMETAPGAFDAAPVLREAVHWQELFLQCFEG